MSLPPRIPLVVGTGITVTGLIMGCFVAGVSTFSCTRDGADRQGICRLEQSTLFLPWNKRVTSLQLSDIEKAESIEVGVDTYDVVLQLRSSAPKFSLYRTESSSNSQELATQINSFIDNPKAKEFSFQAGDGLGEKIALISFCGFGVLLVGIGTRLWRADSRLDLVEK